jgi:hypothetical protein
MIGEPHPISTGLLIDFTSRTVRGTERQGPYPFDDQLRTSPEESPRLWAMCSRGLPGPAGSQPDWPLTKA